VIYVGEDNVLKVVRESSFGLFLSDGEDNDVLLPNKYVPEGTGVGDEVKVFVYHDSENRIVATTLTPKVKLHEFACLEVKEVTKFGAFLDWGLEKDLLVPLKEQVRKMKVGESHVVCLFIDKKTGRLAASSNLNRFFAKSITVKDGEKVDLLVVRKSDLGIQAVINNRHLGLLYHNEVFQPVQVGDELAGYIKRIRDDGKIDVSLQRQGYGQVKDSQQVVLDKLQENKGFLNLTDKSDPKLIEEQLKMSKKVFKKTIGALYKQKLIKITDDGIEQV